MTTEWLMKGEYLKNCNCAPGCPCDFWSDPTHLKCEGMCGMRVNEGNYGDVSLNGLIFVCTYHWPGPLHEGNGTLQPFILDKSTEEQRKALLTIMSGKAGNPWFEVLASLISTLLEPQFVPIDFEFDLEKRHAKVAIEGALETISSPIINKANGEEHRIRFDMPKGMEYFRPEIAMAKVLKGTGEITFNWPDAHSSMSVVEHTEAGLKA